ncbi:TetR/AcrR family transcriptional regulator [Alkalicoccobacillus murimartini]|uniref:TetR/AcrR family transcriptional repressor of nem operon n=1 Tax=Alkalicoccobacillus murimartini TaxID=171685 RepID=A0ABT9YGL4_9BACI|nr:TetR/AcrR family transcriptional regulator [Alkalicoccobacillus murimartini]MDQ0206625.1 TetR/AcrR family transcriptional repressor of nem operon [Alkalicoccobacillus murimartini]
MARNKEFDEQEVLSKAMEVFWKQGYEKTSLQDLVDHMGIHRRSIYDTFGDKRALFIKALMHYEETITKRIQKKVESKIKVKQAIRDVFDVIIYPDDQNPRGCLTVNAAVELSLLDSDVSKKVTEMFDKTETLFYDLIRHGQETGEISTTIDAKGYAHFIHNSLVGLRVIAKTTEDQKKMKSIVDVTLSTLD